MLVAGIALTPTLFMWNMSSVAKLAPAGIGGAAVLILCMIIGSLIYVGKHGVDHEMAHIWPLGPKQEGVPQKSAIDNLISVFCKSIFSFCGVSIVPTMRQEMIHPEKTTRCVVGAMTIVTLVYIIVCIPTILAFGEPAGALLQNVEPVLLYLGAAGVVVHVFIALPLVLNVFYNTCALTILPIMKTRSVASVSIRFAVVVCCVLLPMIFAKLGALLDLVSAITITGTMIHLPVLFNFQLQVKKTGSVGGAINAIGFFNIIWQVVMCLVGAIAIVLGLKSGISELQDPNQCP